MNDHDDERTHLLLLSRELKRRDWPAQIHERGKRPTLKVTNPADARLNESIVCFTGDDDRPVYCIPGGQVLGPVADAVQVADQLQDMLRSLGA